VPDEHDLDDLLNGHLAAVRMQAPPGALPIVEVEQPTNDPIQSRVEADVQLADGESSVAVNCQQADQVVRGSAERDRLGARQHSLYLAEPVGDHFVYVRQGFAGDPLARSRQIFGRGLAHLHSPTQPDDAIASLA